MGEDNKTNNEDHYYESRLYEKMVALNDAVNRARHQYRAFTSAMASSELPPSYSGAYSAGPFAFKQILLEAVDAALVIGKEIDLYYAGDAVEQPAPAPDPAVEVAKALESEASDAVT